MSQHLVVYLILPTQYVLALQVQGFNGTNGINGTEGAALQIHETDLSCVSMQFYLHSTRHLVTFVHAIASGSAMGYAQFLCCPAYLQPQTIYVNKVARST